MKVLQILCLTGVLMVAVAMLISRFANRGAEMTWTVFYAAAGIGTAITLILVAAFGYGGYVALRDRFGKPKGPGQ